MWQRRLMIGPAEPRALGVKRLYRSPVCAAASLMTRSSGFALLLFSAFAIADLSVFAIIRADFLGTTARIACACSAGKPWICRVTSRTFCGDIGTFLMTA